MTPRPLGLIPGAMQLRTVAKRSVPYVPAVLGCRSLPPEEQPIFHIEPLTWQAFQELQAESGYFDMKVKIDADAGEGVAENPQRREAKLMGLVVAKQVGSIENLTVLDANDQPVQITTGSELVRAASGMDLDGVKLLRDLYTAVQKRSHLEAGEKKT